MTNGELKDKIRGFITSRLKMSIDDNVNLFTSGIVDSLFAMELVLFVEKQFKIRVDNDDLDLNNFNSVCAIADFSMRKLANK
jgi:acyl carrier protein